ncbi:MAG: hypothetical protein [Bacteriophage sp.]|nr:MAG: hypothetical protein [Bacteriophage sp.]
MDTKAAFEKWWKEEHGNLQDTGFIGQTIKMVAQQAWTASRAAIEIELPRGTTDEIGGYDIDLHTTEKVITSHGIRIKGKTE